MSIRDHSPITIEEFNGLWKRGDADSTPADHFSDCNNVSYIQSGFKTRDGIEPYLPIANVVRMYTYNKQNGQSLLVLDDQNNIYDTDFPTTVILHFTAMTDFAFVAWDGRAYISPTDGNLGLDEALFVYKGDGTPARTAAGPYPVNADGALAAANSATGGNVEAGIHIFAVAYETDTGFITRLGPDVLPTVTAPGNKKVDLSAIPKSPETYVTKRHILATKLIQPQFYTGNTRGYQFFFVPDGVIADNTTTTLTVNFFDVELIEDASYLLDLYALIPAPVGLSIYHNRLVTYGEHDNPSVIRLSAVGEPEAIDTVDGLVIFPLDGNPVTNVQEFRDILYAFKLTRTNSWSDNGDVPATWPMTVLDNGVGCGLHAMTTVLDSESINIDFLLVGSLTGIQFFNGTYQGQELTWKIRDFWLDIDRDTFNEVQILNNSIAKILYLVLPDGTMLIGDYSNALSAEAIRWGIWTFDPFITSIALFDKDTLVLSSNGMRV